MLRHWIAAFLTLAVSLVVATASARATDAKRDALWAAVRAGDAKAVAAALDSGAELR